MHLTPRERDKLLIFMAAQLARRRLDRGVKTERARSHRPHHGFRGRRRRATGAVSPN